MFQFPKTTIHSGHNALQHLRDRRRKEIHNSVIGLLRKRQVFAPIPSSPPPSRCPHLYLYISITPKTDPTY